IRKRDVVESLVLFLDPHQPPRLLVSERPQQHRIYHAENRRRRSNPQHQRDHCSQRKSLALPQSPRTVREIFRQIVQPIPTPPTPPPFLHPPRVPNPPRSPIPRLFLVPPALAQLPFLHPPMHPHLLTQPPPNLPPTNQHPPPPPHLTQPTPQPTH